MSDLLTVVKTLDPGIEPFIGGTLPQALPGFVDFKVLLLAQFRIYGINLAMHPSWSESQFRSLESGRGPAVAFALGESRAQSFIGECQSYADEYNRKNYSSQKLVGGMRQALADTLAIGILSGEDALKAYRSLQKRVIAGYSRLAGKKPALHQYLDQVNAMFNGEMPENTFAATPVGGLTAIVQMFDAE